MGVPENVLPYLHYREFRLEDMAWCARHHRGAYDFHLWISANHPMHSGFFKNLYEPGLFDKDQRDRELEETAKKRIKRSAESRKRMSKIRARKQNRSNSDTTA